MWWYYIYFLLLLTCLATLVIRRKNITPHFIYLFSLLTTAILVESINYIWRFADNKQFLVFHLYQPIEYSILGLLYHNIIINKIVKKAILISIPIYILYCVIVSFTIQPISQLDTYAFNAEAILLIIIIVIYLVQVAKDEVKDSMFNNVMVWVSLGLLVFYAGTFFQMGLYHFIKNTNAKLAKQLYFINYFLNYFMYSLFSIGFLCQKSK